MDQTFHLGLTMAGAVSAGAYTGGVLDYLLQVMDAWEAQRGEQGIPGHKVSLDIISGASAGGITGAMAALAIYLEKRNPVTPDKRKDTEYLKSNVFYNAWVNLTRDDMIPVLLDDGDIERNGKAVSLLNSDFIEQLAAQTITAVPECTTAPPAYVNRQMELVLTLSNLNGFIYRLGFAGDGTSHHIMKQHRDYAFFRLGTTYGGDGRIPLNLQRDDTGLTELVQSAPATGAFPIGLAYRKFVRKKKYILDNEDLVVYKKGNSALLDPSEDDPDADYVTYNVDGGMLNNEPFDLTMKIMARRSTDQETAMRQELKKEEQRFDSSIIMIDPFPSEDSIVVQAAQEKSRAEMRQVVSEAFPFSIWKAIGKVYASMSGELLFKGEDIVKAFSKEDFSRFMISPRRKEKLPTGEVKIYNGSVAIACGALGGFSGFFDKAFREHDFYLGRANCQSFLRKYFRVQLKDGVPVNPLFAAGYDAAAVKRFRFQDEQEIAVFRQNGNNPDDAPWYVPIIPDVLQGDDRFTEQELPYPAYNMQTFEGYKKPLLARFKKILLTLSKDSWANRQMIHLGFLLKGNKIFSKLKDVIAKDFESWNLDNRSHGL